METEIKERLERAVLEKVFPGAVVGVVQRDGTRIIIPAGNFTYDESPAVLVDTMFDIASITKSIPTGCIALKLIEERKLHLDDQLTQYLPEYQNNYREKVLIKHLLTYSIILDFPIPGFTIQKATPDDVRKNLLTTDLKFPPGEVAQYSNSPALLLAMVIEKIIGKTIDVLGAEYFFTPLGMNSSTFSPKDPLQIPPTEIEAWRGLVQGFVHDETSYVLGKERPSGCAGLFSNAGDILTFLEMLLNGGQLRGTRYFSEDMVQQMHMNQLEERAAAGGASMGLGWELNEPRFMGKFANPNMFGKTGFTGTVCVLDPEKGTAFTLLSNRTYPQRGTSDPINEVRRDISDMVFSTSV